MCKISDCLSHNLSSLVRRAEGTTSGGLRRRREFFFRKWRLVATGDKWRNWPKYFLPAVFWHDFKIIIHYKFCRTQNLIFYYVEMNTSCKCGQIDYTYVYVYLFYIIFYDPPLQKTCPNFCLFPRLFIVIT